MSTLIAEDLRPFVAEAVRSGRYLDESAVVDAALKLLRELHSSDVLAKVDAGLAQSRAGDVIEISDAAQYREYFNGIRRRATNLAVDAQ